MNTIEKQIKKVIQRSLADIQVELGDEFDRNFERKAFFTKAWQRRKYNKDEHKPILVDTGTLRRSITSQIKGDKIIFISTTPYASLHNEGGTITVTQKMKGYFWHRYQEAIGGFGYTKKGDKRKDKKNTKLMNDADFYKAMALKKVGSKIIIPKRQFIGSSPEVETLVRHIAEKHLNAYFNNEFQIKIKK